MDLEFRVHELKESSRFYKMMCSDDSNEFVIVGEYGKGEIKVHRIDEEGEIALFGDFLIDETALVVGVDEVKPTDCIVTLDVPKKHLNMDVIEVINRLNKL